MSTTSERAMVRDALAQARAVYAAEPTSENGGYLSGVRYVAELLGMPEARTDYPWSTGTPPPDRQALRRLVLRRRRPRTRT